MPDLPDGYLNASREFKQWFDKAHDGGALDKKTKELIHLALALAFHCEP
jgi:alkylhydroperoxidase/carboxymuconolactone decarboxylase family protein YurZ